jgi:hypothetical protein
MTHPTESEAARAIEALRQGRLHSNAEAGRRDLGRGVYTSWDPEGGVTLSARQDRGTLVSLEAQVSGTPRWNSFNLELGTAAFVPGDILIVVADIEGAAGHRMSAFVRSAGDGRPMSDTHFSDPLEGSGTRAVRTLLHAVRAHDGLAGAPRFHTLVVALPCTDFGLTLHDLRLAVVPAVRGIRLVSDADSVD